MNQTARNDHQLERQADRQKEHAVILLHGLCGSSLELGTIPKALKKANCTVVEMQIPNYSASMTDPRLTPNWMDWCAMVESKVVKLKEEHKTVSLCGLSMGATLALAVASFSKEILCVVLLSPVLRYDGWSIPWYHRLMNIPYSLGYRNWTYKESDPYGIKNFEMRRRVAAALKKDGVAAVGAAAIPARHLWAAQKLMAYVRQSLSQVRAGTLVIHSIDDETAAPRNAEMILANINAEVRKVVWLGDCYHIITVDNEREIVTNEAAQFIRRNIEMHSNDISLKYLLHNSPLKDRR
ncbi:MULTISPECIES: alpha/beta fold hydrolase [unclassified Herbaspirillum]|jgi:carboxylesterase|uniref:alpha/beta hydrolase n=1 Tax=unclassified Herbaspirillum TaxID=2624150 RepID=UPI000E2F181E|nr:MULTISPECIES: alpha/beta fold hydrolase [unclassified Herbaspirillum]RFB73214.1 alpha/beta fold hydrolase [Herbaspirillum sp. 3R-3a1]TFI10975.1 alpha/beta fold hydrolase [Herbaspirillum sp. 3R11]TFI16882.1 alpha/beta fold hydrolase [Herbaspirillum sp. 3R-11]TFI30529.1 alpha/beta fold hydrolase [Herbaspirillum sp. 3C11]